MDVVRNRKNVALCGIIIILYVIYTMYNVGIDWLFTPDRVKHYESWAITYGYKTFDMFFVTLKSEAAYDIILRVNTLYFVLCIPYILVTGYIVTKYEFKIISYIIVLSVLLLIAFLSAFLHYWFTLFIIAYQLVYILFFRKTATYIERRW